MEILEPMKIFAITVARLEVFVRQVHQNLFYIFIGLEQSQVL